MIQIKQFNASLKITDPDERIEDFQNQINHFLKENKLLDSDVINVSWPNPYVANLVYTD